VTIYSVYLKYTPNYSILKIKIILGNKILNQILLLTFRNHQREYGGRGRKGAGRKEERRKLILF
jgi:hypothetical protein